MSGVARARPTALVVSAWVVGASTTALVAGSSALVFGLRSPDLHLVFDSVDACVALLLAFLFVGRFLRLHRLQDLLTAHALLLLAGAGLGLTMLLDVSLGLGPDPLAIWLPLTLRVAASLCVLAAALAGNRRTAPGAFGPTLLPWVVVGLVATTLVLLREDLPVALDPAAELSAEFPVIIGHPGLLIAQAVSALCLLAASVLFAFQARHRHDELLQWLAAACALGGFARVNYLLFPSIYSDWIYTGDLLRNAFYLLLLVGAAREIRQYWTARATVAVFEDRRRLAHELHDGLIQEVTYIRSEATTITDSQLAERIVGACDRALDEARAAVTALGTVTEAPLGRALDQAAREVVERYGGRLVTHVDPEVVADDRHQLHALARITREAAANALRHGGATCVRLHLERVAGVRRLVLHDDGCGFDVQAVAGSGYGLTSMRERANALPGSLELRSRPGEGTKVLVEW